MIEATVEAMMQFKACPTIQGLNSHNANKMHAQVPLAGPARSPCLDPTTPLPDQGRLAHDCHGRLLHYGIPGAEGGQGQ